MEPAWHVLGEKASMSVPRDDKPVEIISTRNHDESITKAKNILQDWLEKRSEAFVAVVCRCKVICCQAGQSAVPWFCSITTQRG
jgi:hypothetical protein